MSDVSEPLPPQDDPHMPQGDSLEPKRQEAEGAEPLPSDLEGHLDQVEGQDLSAPGPGAKVDAPVPGAQAEDEGPTGQGGGQSLETGGGGGR